jgi:hypothetical protein
MKLDEGAPPLFSECNRLFVIEAGIQLCAVQKLFGVCCGGCTVRSAYAAGGWDLKPPVVCCVVRLRLGLGGGARGHVSVGTGGR